MQDDSHKKYIRFDHAAGNYDPVPATKPQSTTETLEPCPFCGSGDLDLSNGYDEDANWVVICRGCKSSGTFCVEKSKAISRWNTRISPAAPVVDEAAIERKCVLGLIERFQREPKRAQGTINALEWLRRQIEEGNHAHHAFEAAPANAGFCKDGECFRCGLPRNALMHMAYVPPAAATAAPQVNNCPKCGGSGEIEIGCAMDHALTAPCVECGGSGHATAAPVEQSDASQSCQRCGRIGGKIVNFNYDSITTSRWICPHCLDANEEVR